MARPSTVTHLADILAAASHWKERCLLADGSVFTEGDLWTANNIDAFEQYFVQNPQPGKAAFMEKFRIQLDPEAPTPVRQLGAEMLWVLLLFSSNIGGERKRHNVSEVWSWSGSSLDSNHPLMK